MIEIHDADLHAALQTAIGHAGPFTQDELAGLRALHVTGSSDLDALTQCAGLERLELIGCDASDLAPIASLARLRRLDVIACPIEDLTSLARLTALEELDIAFGFVRDLGPALALPALRRCRCVGHPLDPGHRAALVAQSLSKPDNAPVIDLGPTEAWEMTRRLWDHQIRLCFADLDGLRTVLVRPGKSRTDGLDVEASDARPSGVGQLIERGTETDALFVTVSGFWDRKGAQRPSDFASHRQLGDHRDAVAWIDEAPASDRAALLHFVRRFPGLTFYREDATYAAAVGAVAGVEMPAAIAASRAVLAGALPDQRARFRLGSFAGSAPRTESLDKISYVSAPGVYSSDERAAMMRDRARMFTLAEWIETGRSFLAAKLDGDDPAIYEYGEADLRDAEHDGRPLADSIYRVFTSHAELLGHIVAYQLPDGTVLEGASP